MTYGKAKEFCKIVGGRLIAGTPLNDMNDIIIGDVSRCKAKHWTPIVQAIDLEAMSKWNKNLTEYFEQKWVTDSYSHEGEPIPPTKSPISWAKGQPDGLNFEKCTVRDIDSDEYFDEDCAYSYCSLCQTRIFSTLRLRGMPGIIDTDAIYYLEGGYTSSWEYYSIRNQALSISFPNKKIYHSKILANFNLAPYGLLKMTHKKLNMTFDAVLTRVS